MEPQTIIKVECYAGYRGEETPLRFVDDERRVEVTEVLDAWLAPDHRYFKVAGHDGSTYLLRHDVWNDFWSLASDAESIPPSDY